MGYRTSDKSWDMAAAFFAAKRLFTEQFNDYESQVLALAAERQVDRLDLALDANQVSQLLDYERLSRLVDEYLRPLRALAAESSRAANSPGLFHRYVSTIYHEISILKEEHYEVEHFGPQYEATQEDEIQLILAEVHEYFPKRIHRVHRLFAKAQARLAARLPTLTANKVFVRSLYLMGPEVLAEGWDGTLESFYAHMYPVGGIVEGILDVARSFAATGFVELASKALGEARAHPFAATLPEAVRASLWQRAQTLEQQLAG